MADRIEKTRTTPTSPDRMWFTRIESAVLCGMVDRAWDAKIRPRMAAAAIRGNGTSLRFYGPGVFAAARQLGTDNAKPTPAEDDPLLAGGDSPALERYRLAKAKITERDLAERESEIVRVSVIRSALAQGVVAIRETGGRLIRRFGNEAGELFNEGVSEFEAAALKSISDTPENASGSGK